MEIEKSKVPALTRAAKLLDILAQFGPMTRSELVNQSNIPTAQAITSSIK